MEHTLSDGTRVLVRPIRPDDKAELEAGLGRLSDLSVHRRFLAPKRHFSASELRYLTEVDGQDHVALVAELADDPGRIVGVARYVRLLDEPETAEAAFVVADPLQGRGLGSMMAGRLVREAVRHGIRRFSATMLSDNVASQRLMARLTRDLQRRHGGAGHSEVLAELAA